MEIPHSLFNIFILNIFVNSLLMFFTIGFLIHLLLLLFRIKNEKVKILAYLIPFLKLPYDLFFNYYFSEWALAKGLNPFEMPEGTRMITLATPNFFEGYSAKGFWAGFHLQDGSTFTVADCLGIWLGSSATTMISWGILLSLIGALIYGINSFKASYLKIKHTLLQSKSFSYIILNPLLKKNMAAAKIQVFSSNQIPGPCVIGWHKPTILFPAHLIPQLSQEEFEAILAHELEHVKRFDAILNLFLNLVNYLFWWIPTGWLKRKIALNQEYTCDKSVFNRYGISPLALAEAIHKASSNGRMQIGIPFANKPSILLRLNKLLHIKTETKWLSWTKAFLFFALAVGLFFGKFWTF